MFSPLLHTQMHGEEAALMVSAVTTLDNISGGDEELGLVVIEKGVHVCVCKCMCMCSRGHLEINDVTV